MAVNYPVIVCSSWGQSRVQQAAKAKNLSVHARPLPSNISRVHVVELARDLVGSRLIGVLEVQFDGWGRSEVLLKTGRGNVCSFGDDSVDRRSTVLLDDLEDISSFLAEKQLH